MNVAGALDALADDPSLADVTLEHASWLHTDADPQPWLPHSREWDVRFARTLAEATVALGEPHVGPDEAVELLWGDMFSFAAWARADGWVYVGLLLIEDNFASTFVIRLGRVPESAPWVG